MGKFLAIHPLTTPITVEEGTPIAKAVKACSTLDAYWVCSWLQLNEQGKIVKIFCEWNAKDMDSIMKVFKEVAKRVSLPTEGVYPMGKLDAEDFR